MRVLTILAAVVVLLVIFVIIGIEENEKTLAIHWITGISIIFGSVLVVYRWCYRRCFAGMHVC